MDYDACRACIALWLYHDYTACCFIWPFDRFNPDAYGFIMAFLLVSWAGVDLDGLLMLLLWFM